MQGIGMQHSNKHFEIICNLVPYMQCENHKIINSKLDMNILQLQNNISSKQTTNPVKFNKKDKDNNNKEKVNDNHVFVTKSTNLMETLIYVMKNISKPNIINENDIDTQSFAAVKRIVDKAIETCKEDKGARIKCIKLTCKNFVNTIFSCSKIDYSLLYALCVYHQINLAYIQSNALFIFGSDPNQIDALVNLDKSKHIVEITPEINVSDYFIIENPVKPLKTASSYKIADIQDLCVKMNVDTMLETKPKKKAQMYDELQIKLSYFMPIE